MAAIAEEFPEEKWGRPGVDDADEFEPKSWHDLYFRAFDALQFDRFYGAFGGEGPIFYTALSRYAEDLGLSGMDRHLFMVFMNAVDGEWLKHQADEAKKREERRKEREARR